MSKTHSTAIWYSVPDVDGDVRYRCVIGYGFHEDDLDIVAADAAKNYFEYHDGWETSWPQVFVLYLSEDGEPIGKCSVSMELEPSFSARRIDPCDS